MRGRSYSPSPPPRGGYSRRGRSPSPRGRYTGRGRDPSTSLLVRNLRHDCRFVLVSHENGCYWITFSIVSFMDWSAFVEFTS